MLRRLGVAQAIIHEPKTILLDEPTAGLDPLQRVAVREVIQSGLSDKTVLLSTHLVEDIRHLAQYVVVIDNGQVVFQGSVIELEQIAPADAIGESQLEQALNSLYLGKRK
jgi:ABC-2 type transport system ATP-binding protein